MCLPTKSILQIAVSAAASSAIQLNTEKRDDVTIGNDRTFSEGWRSSPHLPMYHTTVASFTTILSQNCCLVCCQLLSLS